MNKAAIRKVYLEKRMALSEAEYLQLNRQLCENFFAFTDLSFVKVLHSFLPITEKREVDTWLIIDRIRREFPNIRLSVPRINKETETLEHFYFEGLHQLEKNQWGILEPKQGVPTPFDKIDLVLVPLLAFDKQGHRVGYGKGYYDRFLGSLRDSTKKIGLSHFAPVNEITTNQNDVVLSSCLTPYTGHH